jgi:hypothetical protein
LTPGTVIDGGTLEADSDVDAVLTQGLNDLVDDLNPTSPLNDDEQALFDAAFAEPHQHIPIPPTEARVGTNCLTGTPAADDTDPNAETLPWVGDGLTTPISEDSTPDSLAETLADVVSDDDEFDDDDIMAALAATTDPYLLVSPAKIDKNLSNEAEFAKFHTPPCKKGNGGSPYPCPNNNSPLSLGPVKVESLSPMPPPPARPPHQCACQAQTHIQLCRKLPAQMWQL